MRSKKRGVLKSKRKSKRRTKIHYSDGGNIQNNDEFTLISLIGCPYCREAKEIIKQKKFKMNSLDLKTDGEKTFWNKFVISNFKKEHNTFPKIFHKGKFIGGCSDLQKYLSI